MATARRRDRSPGQPSGPRRPLASRPDQAPTDSEATVAGWRSYGRHSLPIAVVLMFITALGFFRQTDPDFWWHWRAGQDILATGQLPRVDQYSATVAGQPWVAHEWLWEVLTAAIMASVGYVGISVLLASLLLATFGLLYALLRAQGLVEWAAAGLVALAGLMSTQTLTARPHAATYLCVIITAWLLHWWRHGHERRLWWLVALLVPWANLHGGYAIGLGLLGLTLAGEVLDALLARRRPRVTTPIAVGLAGAVAASLNPQGPFIHLFALSFLNRDSAMQRYIQEWASPNFHDFPGQAFGVGLLLLAVVGLRGSRLSWSVALPALAVTWLGLQGVRHLPLFALVGLPALAAGLAAWPALAARRRAVEPAGFVLVNWLVTAGLWLATALLLVGQPLAQIRREPNESWFPREALAYLQIHQPAGRIFNYDGWGGYLIARAPDYPVAIDGRTDLYGTSLLEEYRQVIALEPGWRDVLTRRDIRLVLVRPQQALANALRDDPAWEVLIETPTEILLSRR